MIDRIAVAQHVGIDDVPWVDNPAYAGTQMRLLQADVDAGVYAMAGRLPAGLVVGTHHHSGAVHMFTLSGAWGYREHDYMNVAGSYLYEPPGSVHTLFTPDDNAGITETLTIVYGTTEYLDPDGNVVAVSDVGYVDRSLDADAFDDEGWFRTGDLGRIDELGHVRITGRLKDIVIRNAENISVLEIEELLFRHPAVSDAAVLGLPDPRTGERVCAVVALRPGESLTLDALRQHCRAEGLSLHKCPEQLEVVDELPHNAMGKVAKAELRSTLTTTPSARP